MTRYSTYQFEVTPFGLMNAPATFQRMMDSVLKDVPFANAYLDDVVVFSKTISEHIVHPETVLALVAKHKLRLKLQKCDFAKKQVCLLEHIVSARGVRVNPQKVEAIKQALVPHDATSLRSFLRLAGYYRRFMKNFPEISSTFYPMTSKNAQFQRTESMQVAFDDLKGKLTCPPVLSFPEFDNMFMIETDGSSVAVGAVLSQKKLDVKVQPVQFGSRSMNAAECNYSACEQGALAIVFGLEKFRVYLLSSEQFTLVTDHQALQYAFKKKGHSWPFSEVA